MPELKDAVVFIIDLQCLINGIDGCRQVAILPVFSVTHTYTPRFLRFPSVLAMTLLVWSYDL